MKNIKRLTSIFTILFLLVYSLSYGQDKQIEFKDLPQTSKTFINTNFKGIKITHVIEESGVFGIDEYKVHLSNGMHLEFDKKGDWKEIDGNNQKIPYGFILSPIKEYAVKRFPNTYITKIEKNKRFYKIELSNDKGLEFDSKGKFKKLDN